MQRTSVPETKQRIIAHAEANRLHKAHTLCQKLCQSDHADAEAWFILGVLEGQLGRADNAMRAYRKAVALNPDYFTAHYNLGCMLIAAGHSEQAIACLREAVRAKPDFTDALTNLGALLKTRGDLDEAIDCQRRALQANPRLALAHYNLGNALFEKSDFESAIASYQLAVRIDPQYTDAYANMGRAAQALGRPDLAIDHYRRALAANPNLPEVHHRLATALSAQDRRDAAIQCCLTAIRLRPDYVEAHVTLGDLLAAQDRLHDAAAAYGKALNLDPGNTGAHTNLGAVLFSLGRFQDAEAAYRRALEARPDYAEGWHNLGNTLRELGRTDEAKECYRHALALRPDLAQSQYMLATLAESAAPAKPPPGYVAQLFDQYAWKFDGHLLNDLEYHTPERLLKAAQEALGRRPRQQLDILDLGCGTGLCGPLFRPLARVLAGVDLSLKMLDKARDRGVYDRLIHGDLVLPLEEPDAAYDLIVAADVFVYIGDLTDVFAACRAALRPDGLFIFSTEAETDGDGYRLRSTGRYAHTLSYIRRLAESSGLSEASLDQTVIRKEKGEPVEGYIVVMKRNVD